MGLSRVESNENVGIYVWMMNSGKPFTDGNGNVLNIPSRRFDIVKMNKLRAAARHYGAPDGDVKFWAGVNRVSEMRASEERGRMAEGLIPSETDIGAWADAERSMREGKIDD